MFLFIRTSFRLSYRKLQLEFEKLLNKLKSLENNRYETRAFLYLDICSWLESKLSKTGVDKIIRRKFEQRLGK